MREIAIGSTLVDDQSDCYVIAEIGHNHQGSVPICKELFEAAAWAGCDAVKLQKRDNKSLYTEEMYDAPYNSENAFGPTYGAHREALEFGQSEYVLLKAYAESLGLEFFATAFDIPSAKFLFELGVSCFKVASGDLRNRDLLGFLRGKNIQTIISTGGASLQNVVAASRVLGNCPHAILHCTSGYPASYAELNLRVIPTFREKFPAKVIGWSAHDTGIAMAPVAYALGARIIEKHFTLDRTLKGTDQAMSLEPQGMKTMIENLRHCKTALGSGVKNQYASEIEPLKKQRKNAQGRVDGKSES